MKTCNAKLYACLGIGFGAVVPAWAQIPMGTAQKRFEEVASTFTPEMLLAIEQAQAAQAARELQFIIAGALLVFIANVLSVWLAGRADSNRKRSPWLREVACQWALVAIAFALQRFDVVSVEAAVIGCVLGILARFFFIWRDVRRLSSSVSQ